MPLCAGPDPRPFPFVEKLAVKKKAAVAAAYEKIYHRNEQRILMVSLVRKISLFFSFAVGDLFSLLLGVK